MDYVNSISSTMKVLSIVTNRYAPFYQQQAKALESNSVNLHHCYPQKQTPHIEEIQNNSRTRMDYLAMYRSVWRESLNKYDLVHANNGPTVPFAVAQPQRPLVITLWGSDLMGNSTWLTRNLVRLADHIIVPSEKMLKYLNCNATVIPFGIGTELFSPMSKEKAREKTGWEQEKTIILFPASPERPVKNYELAESVVNSLSTDIELRVLTGVPYERVPYYMNASDAVLVTSKRESGPMVAKEAALCNVPVVSTDVGFVSEALSNVTHSYVASSTSELKNQLRTVIDSGERSNGRKYAHKWGLDRMGERLIDVYQSVL